MSLYFFENIALDSFNSTHMTVDRTNNITLIQEYAVMEGFKQGRDLTDYFLTQSYHSFSSSCIHHIHVPYKFPETEANILKVAKIALSTYEQYSYDLEDFILNNVRSTSVTHGGKVFARIKSTSLEDLKKTDDLILTFSDHGWHKRMEQIKKTETWVKCDNFALDDTIEFEENSWSQKKAQFIGQRTIVANVIGIDDSVDTCIKLYDGLTKRLKWVDEKERLK